MNQWKQALVGLGRGCWYHQRQLLPYLDGTLTLERRSGLSRHLGRCPSCRQELLELQRVTGVIREATDSRAPVTPSDLWERLEGKLRAEARQSRRGAYPAWGSVLAAAVVFAGGYAMLEGGGQPGSLTPDRTQIVAALPRSRGANGSKQAFTTQNPATPSGNSFRSTAAAAAPVPARNAAAASRSTVHGHGVQLASLPHGIVESSLSRPDSHRNVDRVASAGATLPVAFSSLATREDPPAGTPAFTADTYRGEPTDNRTGYRGNNLASAIHVDSRRPHWNQYAAGSRRAPVVMASLPHGSITGGMMDRVEERLPSFSSSSRSPLASPGEAAPSMDVEPASTGSGTSLMLERSRPTNSDRVEMGGRAPAPTIYDERAPDSREPVSPVTEIVNSVVGAGDSVRALAFRAPYAVNSHKGASVPTLEAALAPPRGQSDDTMAGRTAARSVTTAGGNSPEEPQRQISRPLSPARTAFFSQVQVLDGNGQAKTTSRMWGHSGPSGPVVVVRAEWTVGE